MAFAVVAGILGFVGFVGVGVYPLAFVAWLPILHGIRGVSPARAAVLGLVFGTVLNLGGYYWIAHVLTEFGNLNHVTSVLALIGLCVYQGAMLAVVVYLVLRGEADLGLKPIWTLPIAYPALEFVYPILFTASYGVALYQLRVLTQIVDVTGVLGLTALVAVVNGALWEVVEARTARRALVSGRVVIPGAFVLAVVVYGLVRLPAIEAQIASAPTLKVALIQTNIGAREKMQRPEAFVERHWAMSREAVARDADVKLIVWPETIFSRGVPRNTTHVARTVTRGLGVPIAFGAITYEGSPGRLRIYNSAMLAAPDGTIVARFDKVRLVAFSEALPWIATASGLDGIIGRWLPNAATFVPGTTFEPFRMAEAVLLPTICYEATFGAFVREFWRRAGPADVLLNLTNDSWFGDTHEPRIHLAVASFRAIETRRALVRATNTGISAVVDPAGRIVRRTGQWTQAILTADVPVVRSAASAPYQTIGDLLGWLCLALVVLGAIAVTWRRRVRSR